MPEDTFSNWERWMGVIKVTIAALGLVLSTALYVYGADAAASQRIAVLETKYDLLKADVSDMRAQLAEIRADVKILLARKP